MRSRESQSEEEGRRGREEGRREEGGKKEQEEEGWGREGGGREEGREEGWEEEGGGREEGGRRRGGGGEEEGREEMKEERVPAFSVISCCIFLLWMSKPISERVFQLVSLIRSMSSAPNFFSIVWRVSSLTPYFRAKSLKRQGKSFLRVE